MLKGLYQLLQTHYTIFLTDEIVYSSQNHLWPNTNINLAFIVDVSANGTIISLCKDLVCHCLCNF